MYAYCSPDVDKESGRQATVIITKERVPLRVTFEKYVAEKFADYKSDTSNLEILADRKGEMKSYQGREIVFTWSLDEHIIKQRMVFLKISNRDIITFNASAALNDFNDQSVFFNEILASLEVKKY